MTIYTVCLHPNKECVMRSLWFKSFFSSSLFFLLLSFCTSPFLHAAQAAMNGLSRREVLEKQLASVKEEKEQAEMLSRFAEREAFRVMPIDWSSYHRYLAMQERAQQKAEALDLQSKAIEKELQSIPKDQP